MLNKLQFYIDGKWVDPVTPKTLDVINPANEEAFARISLGSKADVDKAVAAARRAFETFSRTTKEERLALMAKIVEVYQKHYGEIVEAISTEMGAPLGLSKNAQAAMGIAHFSQAMNVLKDFNFETVKGSTAIVYEPVGVIGMITPWNWPINQIACKVAPALAAGCTMVLKPSEIAPMNALLFAQVMDEAGVPPGVFNLINGDGPGVGEAMSAHPGIDMMSFTGSTRAGISVAKAAADTVKRVAQELGGKSPNIVFADADLEAAVKRGVLHCFNNSGQSCNAPTRMLVEESVYDRVVEMAVAVGAAVEVGDPSRPGKHIDPVSSRMQFDKIQRCIEKGIAEGARLVLGGPGRPNGLDVGYYVRPTIFADVTNEMSVARDEIFGPVLSIIKFRTLDEAIEIANDTPYGLAAYVQTQDLDKARQVARRLRAGGVYLNGAAQDYDAPFGGFKQSGNGRECGVYGLLEFLEYKAINGFYAA